MLSVLRCCRFCIQNSDTSFLAFIMQQYWYILAQIVFQPSRKMAPSYSVFYIHIGLRDKNARCPKFMLTHKTYGRTYDFRLPAHLVHILAYKLWGYWAKAHQISIWHRGVIAMSCLPSQLQSPNPLGMPMQWIKLGLPVCHKNWLPWQPPLNDHNECQIIICIHTSTNLVHSEIVGPIVIFKRIVHSITHTHTQPFYCSSGICPGPPRWAGTRKVKPGRLKPIWIYWSKR